MHNKLYNSNMYYKSSAIYNLLVNFRIKIDLSNFKSSIPLMLNTLYFYLCEKFVLQLP